MGFEKQRCGTLVRFIGGRARCCRSRIPDAALGFRGGVERPSTARWPARRLDADSERASPPVSARAGGVSGRYLQYLPTTVSLTPSERPNRTPLSHLSVFTQRRHRGKPIRG